MEAVLVILFILVNVTVLCLIEQQVQLGDGTASADSPHTDEIPSTSGSSRSIGDSQSADEGNNVARDDVDAAQNGTKSDKSSGTLQFVNRSADLDLVKTFPTSFSIDSEDILVTAPSAVASNDSATKFTISSKVGKGKEGVRISTPAQNVFQELTTLAPLLAGDDRKATKTSVPRAAGTTEEKVGMATPGASGERLSDCNSPKTTSHTRLTTSHTKGSDETAIITNTTTECNITSTTVDKNSTTSQPRGCPEMCVCPDYQNMSQALVPFLREWLGQASDKYTDDVLRYYIHQQFMFGNGEEVTSFLSRLNIVMGQELNRQNYHFIKLLNAARFGVTVCWLNKTASFRLDTATEARLFPQVAYKLAMEAAEESSVSNNGDSTLENRITEDGRGGDNVMYSSSLLYNISFVCERGARIVVSADVSLNRYGRWSQILCRVTTDGELIVDKPLPLLELDISYSDANWIFNISVPHRKHTNTTLGYFEDGQEAVVDKNNNSSGINEDFRNIHNLKHFENTEPDSDLTFKSVQYTNLNYATSTNNTTAKPKLTTETVFINLQEVTIVNSTLTLEELSRLLVWFQKSDSLQLKNHTFGNFSCGMLLPAGALYRNLTLSGSGLTSVPPCLLRKSLINLDLSHNSMSDIALFQYPQFVPMPYLKFLNLNDNKISDVGVFSDFMGLSMLLLAGNRISSLYKMAFNRLPLLKLLDLSRNDLHLLEPGTFKALFQLQELHLSYNKLERFDRSVTPMRFYYPDINDLSRPPYSYECRIFLDHNQFSYPPFAENNYKPGIDMVVYASDNPYACDCQMAAYVESAGINTGNYTGRFEDKGRMACRNPYSMRGLSLDRVAFNDTCPLVIDCPQNCSCILFSKSNITEVDCSEVEALSLPDALPGTYPLHVKFQAGDSTAVTKPLSLKDVTYLQRVISLNVSGRRLIRVPEFMCETLPKAVVLDLSRNNLTRLPECLYSRRQDWPYMDLKLSGNPWACDCDAVATVSWLSSLMGSTEVKNDSKVKVTDIEDVRCGGTGMRVAEWDSSNCSLFDYLPVAVAVGSILGLVLVLGPLAYVYRLQAAVAIHATLHVRPFTHQQRFNEGDFNYEALLVHGPSDNRLKWVVDTLLPKTDATRHRLCLPERDFLPGASTAESYATAVERSKATVVLLYADAVSDEWWLYAFQLARAQNARRPHMKLLLLLMEDLHEEQLPQGVKEFVKTHTYLRLDDKWLWKKLFFYLPDPPKNKRLIPE